VRGGLHHGRYTRSMGGHVDYTRGSKLGLWEVEGAPSGEVN